MNNFSKKDILLPVVFGLLVLALGRVNSAMMEAPLPELVPAPEEIYSDEALIKLLEREGYGSINLAAPGHIQFRSDGFLYNLINDEEVLTFMHVSATDTTPEQLFRMNSETIGLSAYVDDKGHLYLKSYIFKDATSSKSVLKDFLRRCIRLPRAMAILFFQE